MTMSSHRDSVNEEIVAVCRKLAQAHADKDADTLAACYAPDAVIYDLAPPLGQRGFDRDGALAWFATWDGPIVVEAADVDLAVSGDVAFTTALNHMNGKKVDGENVDLWFRTTLCFRKNGEGWRIVHDHSSVPFLMDGSQRAALDLQP